jgi:peptide/nickel transport system substrate-binding protein
MKDLVKVVLVARRPGPLQAGRLRQGSVFSLARGFAWAILAAAWIATACGRTGEKVGDAPASESSPHRGGTLVVVVPADFDALNPLVSTDALAQYVDRYLLFTTLVRLDAGGNPVPYLAESWEAGDDGLSLTFHLHKDVSWHDTLPTTAEDVAFTYRRAIDPAVAFPFASSFRDCEGVEVVDPYTVRFRLKRPSAAAIANLAYVPVMPKHLLEGIAPAELRRAAFNHAPVGNGPFQFVRWTTNQEAVFEANAGFPAGLGGRPYLDRVVFRFVPEQTTELTMLLNGEADAMLSVPPQDGTRVEASEKTRLIRFHGYSQEFIAWNERLPFFDTADERRAMTLAIDRRRLVDALLYGYGSVRAALGAWRDSSMAPLPYDPAGARALLAVQGWRDSDGDGVLDQDGRRFEFDIVVNKGNDLRADAALVVKDELAKIGVVARPSIREWTVMLQELKRGDFEAWIGGFSADLGREVRAYYSSRGNVNYVAFSEPRADSLMEAVDSILAPARAEPVWSELQRLLVEQEPYTALFDIDGRLGISRRVRGADSADWRGSLNGISGWWVVE